MPRTPSSRRASGVGRCARRRRAVDCRVRRLFVIGLAMLVSGVAFKATMIGSFPILSVLGFIVMFGGVVFAITGPRCAGGRDTFGAGRRRAPRQRRARVPGRFVHQPHGGSLPPSFRRVSRRGAPHARGSPVCGCPFFVGLDALAQHSPHRHPTDDAAPREISLAACRMASRDGSRTVPTVAGREWGTWRLTKCATDGAKWGIVG